MIMLWVTLLLLHQGYTLVPVVTVQLGEPVTLTCVLPDEDYSSRLYWYKQSAGDKFIVILWQWTKSLYTPEFSASRWEAKYEAKYSKTVSNLTILRTTEEDEGMYHCALINWKRITWTGTYLTLKGKTQRTSNYTVVQTVSDPVRPGDPVTLQCSVLSDSENKTCPGDPSVYWFRAGSEESHPNIIYTDGNDQCEKRSDTVKSCVNHFSKTISSSDAGTYYCAVATCGEILFGNGTKLDNKQYVSSEFIALVILVICLIISLLGNVFICYRILGPLCAKNKGIEDAFLQARHDNWSQPVDDNAEAGHDLNYAAVKFSRGKTKRARKKKELKTEESVYAQMKC